MCLKRVVLLTGILAIIVGCGSAPVKEQSAISVNNAQIEQMNDSSSLLGAYKQTVQALQGKDPNLYAADYATLKILGNKLASVKVEELTKTFDQARLPSGEVPQTTLTTIKSESESAGVDANIWKPVSDLIAKEVSLTDTAVKERVDQLEVGDLSDDLKLVAMDDLYRLTGSQNWLDQRNAFVDQLIEEIRRAKNEGVLSAELQPKIELVLENRADDSALKEELVAVTAEIYRQDYFKALGDGDADTAYKVFVTMSQSNNFGAIKKSLTTVSQDMVDYFVAEADKSVKNPENLSQSYRWYSQAKVVTNELGLKSNAKSGQKALVEQLHDKYNVLKEEEQSTLALAYLHFIKEFSPLYKGLRQKLSETEENVRSQAIKRLSTTGFKGGSNEGYGDIISSKVTQFLFTHVPNDVRIVEREKYEDILRERGISGSAGGLSAVDLLVTGSILEAKVDTTKQEGKKTIRAVIGKESMPNPAYIKWLEMSSRERDKVDKPSETITVDKEDNIPVNVTNHRKVGIFSVSYRLVNAENGRVLYPDSITKEEEHKGTSREGVEMGDFVLPFELADLPSDVKILDNLANLVSEGIGKSLVEKLKDQEKRYLAEADEFEKDNSCAQQADSLAKALVILDAKGMDKDAIFSQYKDVTINCDSI